MKLNKLSLTLLAAALTSCSLLGPDYSKPIIDAPQSWNSLNGNIESINLADTAWWQHFNDPALNEMIKIALANNNNVQMAMGNILQAQAILQKVQMAWVPTISIGGGGMAGQAFNQNFSSNNPAFGQFAQQNNNTFNSSFVGFMPSYTLNVFQIMKNQQAARLNLKMQQANKDAARLGVISQVAGGYFTLLGLQKQLFLQHQMIDDMKDLRKFTQMQVNKGTSSEMNLKALDQFIAQFNSQVPAIKDNIVQAQNALQLLMNRNPASIITKNTFDNIKTDNIIPLNLPSEVLKTRPDVIASEYQLQASNAKIGVATSKFFPSIALTGGLGASSYDLTNLFSGSADFWTGQIMATMPILNLGIFADIKEAKANYYTAYYNYIQTVRSAFKEVDNGLSKHQSANATYTEQYKMYTAANELYNLSKVQYKVGTSSYSSTLNFKMDVDNTLLNLNQAKMRQLDSIVNLYQALGGGYNIENNEKLKKFHDNHDA